MTNYDKHAGTPERFADFIIGLDCERGTGERLTRQFCRGGCQPEGCTERNLKQCVMAWLMEQDKLAYTE